MNKKIMITIALFISFLVFSTIKNEVKGYLYLNNLDFKVQANTDGSMSVTETWDIDVEDTNTLYKTFKTDNTKYTGITNVKVTEITNGTNKSFEEINKLMYHVTKNCYYGMKNENGDFEIAWGVSLDNSSATKKYQISYLVEDAIAKYDDYAEIYWQFVGKDFEIDARKITGTITLPQNAELKENIKVWGHTEWLNGEIYVTDLNTIKFEVNKFKAGRFVEIRTLFPTEFVNTSARTYSGTILDSAVEQETVWANEANERREARDKQAKEATNVYIGMCVIISIILIIDIKKCLKKLKNNKSQDSKQEIEYYRELPRKNATPSQALSIYNKSTGAYLSSEIGRVFSAMLLDLSLKKFIEFEQGEKNNYTIKILKQQSEELEKSEYKVLEFISKAAGDNNEIKVKELQKYMKKHSSKVVKVKGEIEAETKKEIIKGQIYDKKREQERNNFISKQIIRVVLIGILTMFMAIYSFDSYVSTKTIFEGAGVVSIFLIIFIIIATKTYNRILPFTEKGKEEYAKWKGLKKYMEDFSMLDEREVPELAIWEEFLVYATVFGIADKVLKQLKIVYKDIYQNMDANTYAYMYLMMNTDFSSSFSNSISSAVTSSYYSSSYSSGSGAGGGFSGGGGFGGGRRRRRRKIKIFGLFVI